MNSFLVDQMNLVISIGLPRLPTDKEAKAAPNVYMLLESYYAKLVFFWPGTPGGPFCGDRGGARAGI